MAVIMELGGVRPTIGDEVWLAPTAVLVGDVHVGDRASIWFGTVLRGDSSRITIGAGTSVQDNAVIHCAHDLPTVVGEDVIVGHAAMLEGCVIEDGALVGMGAIVLQRARVGSKSLVAAGAVVGEGVIVGHAAMLEGCAIEDGAVVGMGAIVLQRARLGAGSMLAAGVPAVEKKPLSGSAQSWSERAAAEYQTYRHRYLTTSAVIEGS